MKNLHIWVLAGIIVGVVVGAVLNSAYIDVAHTNVSASISPDSAEYPKALADNLKKTVEATWLGGALRGISKIFLNLLKMVVIPLVFFSLLSGILSLGGGQNLGRMGVKTGGWYLMTSLISIVTGLVFVNLIAPGEGLDLAIPTEAREAHPPKSFWDILINMVPNNVVGAAAKFDMFGVIFFTLAFGAALTRTSGQALDTMRNVIEAGSEAMMTLTEWVMAVSPVGIAALIASTVASTGLEIFSALIWFVLTVAIALGFHVFISMPTLVYSFTKRNPYQYMRAMMPALLTGFSTASSSGTLGVTMETAEKRGGVSKRVTSFVLPLGATVNMDGTALFECVTVLFIAQFHAATHPEFAPLGLGAQLLVVFLALAVSIGAAGIPHAGLVMMVIILNAVNLPLEYTALVWAVDRILDMCRTATNIWSDACGAYVVAHSEGALEEVRV